MTFTRARAALALVMLLSFPLAAAWAKPADAHEADSAAIKKLVADFKTTFNNHDAHAVLMLFTSDADFINVVGASDRGRPEIEQHMASLFTDRLKTIHREVTVRDIRFLRPDIATVDIDYVTTGLPGPNGAEAPPAKGLYDWIVVKESGRWRIAVLHESNYPLAQPAR